MELVRIMESWKKEEYSNNYLKQNRTSVLEALKGYYKGVKDLCGEEDEINTIPAKKLYLEAREDIIKCRDNIKAFLEEAILVIGVEKTKQVDKPLILASEEKKEIFERIMCLYDLGHYDEHTLGSGMSKLFKFLGVPIPQVMEINEIGFNRQGQRQLRRYSIKFESEGVM